MTRIALVRTTIVWAIAAVSLLNMGCGSNQGAAVNITVDVETDVPQLPANFDFGAGSKPILLSAEEVKERQNAEAIQRLQGFLAIVDVRPHAEYVIGHIPKAVHVDLEDWKKQSIVPGGLLDAQAWSQRIGKLGIARVTYVIVYAEQPQDAARIWWTLKYLGVANVAILDGGWKRWLEARGDVTAEIPKVKEFQPPVEFQPERLAEIADLKSSHKSTAVTLVDARSQEEFTNGRIPGAVRIEWKGLLNADGRFKSAEELKAIFRERGIDEKKTTITYCQSGGRAALDAFAMELAGLPNVKNYYCSWQQWSADGDAPVEK